MTRRTTYKTSDLLWSLNGEYVSLVSSINIVLHGSCTTLDTSRPPRNWTGSPPTGSSLRTSFSAVWTRLRRPSTPVRLPTHVRSSSASKIRRPRAPPPPSTFPAHPFHSGTWTPTVRVVRSGSTRYKHLTLLGPDIYVRATSSTPGTGRETLLHRSSLFCLYSCRWVEEPHLLNAMHGTTSPRPHPSV